MGGASDVPTPAGAAARRNGLSPALARGLMLALVVALGAVLRLWGLDASPSGLWYDEGLAGENAMRVLAGERPMFFYADGYPEEPLFFYIQAAFLHVMNDGAPAVLPLRLPAAIIGVLTLLAFYPFCRTMLPARWALFAVLVLALFPWHVHFSRLGFRTSLAPLFVCLIGWGVHAWLCSGRVWVAAITGAAIGLSLYTYTASNILPIAAALGLVWGVALGGGSFTGAVGNGAMGTRQRLLWGVAAGVGAGLVVFGPLLLYYVQNLGQAMGRVAQVAPGDGADFTVGGNLLRVGAFLLGLLGDGTFKHGPAGRPPFPVALVGLWLAGLAFVLASARQRRGMAVFHLLVLVGFLAASVFSQSAPNKLRALGCVPVVVLLFVVGLRMVVVGLRAAGMPRWGGRALVAVVMFFYLWGEATAVIYQWHLDPRIYQQFSGPFTQVARYAAAADPARDPALRGVSGAPRDPRVPLFLPSAVANHATVRYLAGRAFNVRPLTRLEEALTLRPGQPPVVALVLTVHAPGNIDVLRALGHEPQPVASLRNPLDNSPYAVVVQVQRRAIDWTPELAELAAQYLTDR